MSKLSFLHVSLYVVVFRKKDVGRRRASGRCSGSYTFLGVSSCWSGFPKTLLHVIQLAAEQQSWCSSGWQYLILVEIPVPRRSREKSFSQKITAVPLPGSSVLSLLNPPPLKHTWHQWEWSNRSVSIWHFGGQSVEQQDAVWNKQTSFDLFTPTVGIILEHKW